MLSLSLVQYAGLSLSASLRHAEVALVVLFKIIYSNYDHCNIFGDANSGFQAGIINGPVNISSSKWVRILDDRR